MKFNILKREIFITEDGSTSIHLPEWNENYHSKHGAIQEAKHVFIKNGLSLLSNQSIAVLEIGFGTGLNAIITFLESKNLNQKIDYHGVEAYPVSAEEVKVMNYMEQLQAMNYQQEFDQMHQLAWDEKHQLSEDFTIIKRKQFFDDILR